MDQERLLQVAGDGAVDPCQDDAVRLEPRGALGKHLIVEHVASQRVLAEDGEEYPTPLGVGVRGLVEDDGDERLHIDDGGGLRPDGFVGGFVLGEAMVLSSLGCCGSGLVHGGGKQGDERLGGVRGSGGEEGARGVREDEEARRRAWIRGRAVADQLASREKSKLYNASGVSSARRGKGGGSPRCGLPPRDTARSASSTTEAARASCSSDAPTKVAGRGRPRGPRAPRTRRDGGERADKGRRAGKTVRTNWSGNEQGEGSAAALAGHNVRSGAAIGSAALQASESAERRAWTDGARGMRKRIVIL
jgi:hypothetical protein